MTPAPTDQYWVIHQLTKLGWVVVSELVPNWLPRSTSAFADCGGCGCSGPYQEMVLPPTVELTYRIGNWSGYRAWVGETETTLDLFDREFWPPEYRDFRGLEDRGTHAVPSTFPTKAAADLIQAVTTSTRPVGPLET